MNEYWMNVHHNALAKMRKLLDGYMSVEDTHESMKEALAYVMRRGNCHEKADAIDLFDDYKWALHETAAHKTERAAK